MTKPGRKPIPQAEPVLGEMAPSTALTLTSAANELGALDREAELRTYELAQKLGYDGPLDPDVIERGVTLQMRRTVEACLESGRMLMVLKERVGHGNFLVRLERLGVAPRAAQRLMQSALKFSNASTSSHLLEAIGSEGKLIELLTLDEEEIHELAADGSVLGISTDDVAAMSVIELRKALRDARQTMEAKDKVIDKKSKRIDALEEQLEAPYQPSENAAAETAEQQAQLDAIRGHVVAAELELVQLMAVVTDALDDGNPAGVQTFARQSIDYLVQVIAGLAYDHGITVDLAQVTEAPWDAAARAAAATGKGKATKKA